MDRSTDGDFMGSAVVVIELAIFIKLYNYYSPGGCSDRHSCHLITVMRFFRRVFLK